MHLQIKSYKDLTASGKILVAKYAIIHNPWKNILSLIKITTWEQLLNVQ